MPESERDGGGLAIDCLLFSGSPSAIARKISRFVVNSVDGHALRSLAHVSKEVLKAVRIAPMPAVTNLDATSAVAMKAANTLIVTSLMHSPPRPKGSCVFAASCMTMLQTGSTCALSPQTATGFRLASKQAVGSGDRFISAVALTKPSPMAVMPATNISNYC
jgi:hypothetical protein